MVKPRTNALTRKLLRDVWHLRGQVAAIGVVVLCGVATVVAMRTAYHSLAAAQTRYYADYRFADLFAQLRRAPEVAGSHLGRIPGVAAVQTRIVTDVTLDVPGLDEPATGRLVSVPERRTVILNDLHLRRGRFVEPGRREEVVVSESFADANRLAVGTFIGAVINGRWQRLHIVGVAISPEYVYEIRPASVFPDARHFGVLWMSRDALAAAFDMKGAFNDVALALDPDADEPSVKAAVDRLLERYGGLGAYGREEHLSHRFISDEIKQARVSSTVIPAIFLGIAAFLLNVVLSRLVTTQRDQIAVLKAFGYGNLAVGWHYAQLAGAALLAGMVAGVAVGLWLASLLNSMYARFYRFPEFRFDIDGAALILAFAATAAAAMLGAMAAVWRAVRLPPAEAMQPEPPAQFQAGLIERLRVTRRLPLTARIILRNILRKRVAAGLSVFGIALAVSTMLVGRFFLDAVRFISHVQFQLVQRENLNVMFSRPRSAAVRHEVARWPGVQRAEPFRVVPVRLTFGHRQRRTGILGLDQDAGLRRLVDQDQRIFALPPEGLVLTGKLGEVLAAGVGDTLTVEVLEGARPTLRVPIAGFVDEMLGLSAYMARPALARLLRETGSINGVLLSVDRSTAGKLHRMLKRTPLVAGVASRDAQLASFNQTLAESIGLSMTMLIAFAVTIAFAMIYNAARIALSERGRELASLRVLGFSRREVSLMLLGEEALLTTAAIPLGLALGVLIAAWLTRLYQWELFRIPLVISPSTYIFAVVVVVASAAGSGLLIQRRLNRLDLVSVLKTRE